MGAFKFQSVTSTGRWLSRLAVIWLTASLVVSTDAAGAQFPVEEPTNNTLVFGCDPGPIEPFFHEDPPLPPRPVPSDRLFPSQATLVVDGSLAKPPIAGTGFNMEHTLWSCPTFRPSLRRRILEPFRPSVARVDTGQLPLAPDGVSAEELGWERYQEMMAAPRYQPSWEFIRRLNRADVQVMLGVWGAPGAFTDDGTRRGVLLSQHIGRYVEYYTAIVDYLVRVKGLRIWAATIMNEPDGGDGTFVYPDDFVEIARLLGPSLAKYGVKLYGPDTASAETALDYLGPLLDEPGVMKHFAAIAAHQYFPSVYVERLVETVRTSGYDLPVYITEYTSFNFGDLDRGQESTDEVGFMLDIATTLASLYNDGVDAAIYWDAVDYYQAGHAAITTWGLLSGPEDAFFPRKRYYGMLQVLSYLQPGARILSTYLRSDGAMTPLAIHTPGDGREDIAVVLINRGGPVFLDLVFHNVPEVDELEVYLTDDDNDRNHLGHVRIRDGRGELFIPARSIVTLAAAGAPDEN